MLEKARSILNKMGKAVMLRSNEEARSFNFEGSAKRGASRRRSSIHRAGIDEKRKSV